MQDPDHRIRERAYHLWEEAGRPHGQDKEFWEKARELVAIEENQHLATKPNPVAQGADRSNRDQPVEELITVEGQTDGPGLTDQGEKNDYPKPRRRR